tara:strand:+ start:1126 stop:1989 length:864 start_codon:yes stop_codon:yes gene_type:complete
LSYWKFAAMIATSTVVMFVLMYLNTFLWGHVFFSETRVYMAVLMGATMAIIMLAYMLGMYESRKLNTAIFAGSVVVFGAMLWLVRSQATVGDLSYMRAMIPHHSIAIMTSNRSNLSDPRVQHLAEGIVYAQNKEIAEMRYLIDDIEARGDGPAGTPESAPQVVALDEALRTPEVATLDVEPLTPEHLETGLPEGRTCAFTFTTDSPPSAAMGTVDGEEVALIRISGDLVHLPQSEEGVFRTEGAEIRLTTPDGDAIGRPAEQTEADMVLTLDAGLTAGYRGFYDCRA